MNNWLLMDRILNDQCSNLVLVIIHDKSELSLTWYNQGLIIKRRKDNKS